MRATSTVRTRHAVTAALLRLLCSASIAAAGSAAAQSYSFTDLGTLGGTSSVASDINNNLQIVGYSLTAGDTAAHATLWSSGGIIDLGTLGGTNSYASAINDSGRIVGTSDIAGNAGTRATLWAGGTATNLGTVSGLPSGATGISDSGRIVGFYNTGSIQGNRALLWNGPTMSELSSPGAYGLVGATAAAISSSGLVVGTSSTLFNDKYAATAWVGGVPTVLNSTANSFAYGVNNGGRIVGSNGSNPVSGGEAVLWNSAGAAPTTLGGLYANSYGRYVGAALDINNSGLIVGRSATSDCCDWHAVLWKGTVATDLNTFLDASMVNAGWVLESATGINDGGWIVGVAHNGTTGESHAFLLSPVPEPQSYALLLAGLAVTGWTARRRSVRRGARIEIQR